MTSFHHIWNPASCLSHKVVLFFLFLLFVYLPIIVNIPSITLGILLPAHQQQQQQQQQQQHLQSPCTYIHSIH